MINIRVISLFQTYINSDFKNHEIFHERFVRDLGMEPISIAYLSLKEFPSIQFCMRSDDKTPIMIDFSIPTIEGRVVNEPFKTVLSHLIEEHNNAAL